MANSGQDANEEEKGGLLGLLNTGTGEEADPSAAEEVITAADNTKVNVNANNSENVNEDITEEDEVLDALFKKPKRKKKRTDVMSMRGIYFEDEVVKVFDAEGAKNPKGWKSALVNNLVKREFKRRGLL